MKEKILYFLTIFSIIFLAWFSPKYSTTLKNTKVFNQEFVQGKVVKVVKENLMYDPVVEGKFRGHQVLDVEILEGDHKGKTFRVNNSLDSLHNTYATENLEAIFTIKEYGDKTTVWLFNLKRDVGLYILGGIFVGIVCLLGGRKGIKSLLALIFTGAVIIFMLLPLLFTGANPILLSITLSALIIVVSFLLISGFNRKTYSAMVGTLLGVSLAGLITFISGKSLELTGLNLSEGEQLLYIAKDYKLQVEGLLFVSILIASLGAVMDVAMSISSAVNEIYEHKPTLTFGELFKSGMNIGKDIIGTMINTLILAFAGSSLPLMMMIWGYNMSYTQFINIPTIAIEIVNALAGSIGIISTVPVTALVSILFIKKEKGGQK